MSIRTRFSLLILATVLVAAAAGGSALTAMRALEEAIDELQRSHAMQRHAQELKHGFVLESGELSAFLSGDMGDETRARFESFQERVRQRIADLAGGAHSEEERSALRAIEENVRTFELAARRAFFYAKKGGSDSWLRSTRALVNQETYPAIREQTARLSESQDRRAEAAERAARDQSAFAMTVLAVSYGLLFLLAASGVYFIWAWLVHPVGVIGVATERISQGELEHEIAVRGSDELARLARKVEAMARSIRDTQRELGDKERMAALGEMTGAVAHNVRNPLASIRAMAQAWQRANPTNAELVEITKDIMQTVDKADRWVKDLLQELRPVRIDKAPVSVNAVIWEVSEAAKEYAERRGVALRLDVDRALPDLPLDRARMNQALFAVVINAIEASPPGAEVVLHTCPAAQAPYSVEVVVEDHGPGMDADTCRRAFTPFNGTKKGGTGVGLSLTQRIVFGHGGTIVADSAPGAGCRMRIRLPLHSDTDPTPPAARPAQ